MICCFPTCKNDDDINHMINSVYYYPTLISSINYGGLRYLDEFKLMKIIRIKNQKYLKQDKWSTQLPWNDSEVFSPKYIKIWISMNAFNKKLWSLENVHFWKSRELYVKQLSDGIDTIYQSNQPDMNNFRLARVF